MEEPYGYTPVSYGDSGGKRNEAQKMDDAESPAAFLHWQCCVCSSVADFFVSSVPEAADTCGECCGS